MIPDDWWEDYLTRNELLRFAYKPSFDIPDDWWEYWSTQRELLKQGHKPSFDIPDEWWEDEDGREELLKLGYVRPAPVSQPTTLPESASGDITSSSSMTSNFRIIPDAPASEVDDTQRVPLPNDPPLVEATPALAAVTTTTLETVIPSHRVERVVAVPDSASVGQVTTSGINGSVSYAQDLGQRPRSGMKAFFKRLFRRR